ncbi:MAG: guanylate kinase [Actinomycetota bacterium]|nr:guanylate kinase [Actinomycetota bacterium]
MTPPPPASGDGEPAAGSSDERPARLGPALGGGEAAGREGVLGGGEATGREGLLIVVSGPSGVGKGTVVQRLLECLAGVEASVSVTTRPPRSEEIEGADYHFVDDKTFDQLVATGQLLEWASLHRARYGTPRRWVEERLAEGADVLLEIDVQGALQVRRKVSDALLIFLAPPTLEELARRLRMRGTEPSQERAARLETAEAELNVAAAFDHVVINDQLDSCVEEIAGILRQQIAAGKT